MGRTKSNPVGQMFFQYNINTNESTCQVPNCKNPVRTCNHSGNLENHIKYFHKEQYDILLKKKKKNSSYPTEDCSTNKVSIFYILYYTIIACKYYCLTT